MIEVILELIARHRRSGVVVDTSVLLLYFIGRFAPEQITRFKRTENFVLDDFTTLTLLLGRFERLLTTPNVLTEVNSFSRQLGEPLRTDYFERLRGEIHLLQEEYVRSDEVAGGDVFMKFGLTDAGIHLLAQRPYLVLTTDFPLYMLLQSQGIDAINFNNLRPYGWEWLS